MIEMRKWKKVGRPAFTGIITQDTTYIEYESGEKEMYDLEADPYQLESIHDSANFMVLNNLHSRLLAIEKCAGTACQEAEDNH